MKQSEKSKIRIMNNVYTNSRPNESFCKLKSTCGLQGNLDINGMEWNEWMQSKGHHGYTLLERDLQEIVEKTIM